MDNATHYTVIFLLINKGDTLNAYWSFEVWACTQNLYAVIKVLHSDCSSKYLSAAFDKHLADAGTTCQLTVHNTLQLVMICLSNPLLSFLLQTLVPTPSRSPHLPHALVCLTALSHVYHM